MGIPTEILWEWDGNGNENSLPTATLQVTDEKVEVLKLRTTLKRRAEISQGTLKQIFDEEANSSRSKFIKSWWAG